MSKKSSVVGISIFAALILAFFPTSDFISKPYIVDSHVKQQHYNAAGMFTISPFQAAQYFSYDQSNCVWLDVRNAKEYKASHLKVAHNLTIGQLQYSTWTPNDLVIIYGNNTADAQDAAAYLRQVQNVRAYAVQGGFDAVKKFLIQPIGLSVTNQLSDAQLKTLALLRNKLSGENVSPEQMLQKFKSSKPKALREGC